MIYEKMCFFADVQTDNGRKDEEWTMDTRATAFALLTQLNRAKNQAGCNFLYGQEIKNNYITFQT